VEWVETTGKTLEEAKDAALDQLGVDEDDAEFEIVEEPRMGLFGRMRSEARVRARVRPTKPRPKEDRRDRRGRKKAPSAANGGDPAEGGRPAPRPTSTARSEGREGAGMREATGTDEDVPMQEQAEVARTFVEGLLERLGATAAVGIEELDEDTFEVAVTGGDLGLLIGPKGATLSALQDLTRTVVQRKTGGRNGRIVLDVAGYRQRRREALERFTRQLADEVKSTGERRVLEPMHPADRKVVHDTANTIDGVSTTSEGEEPRRHVVILPN
jgi:spoIIIJ-associated protein